MENKASTSPYPFTIDLEKGYSIFTIGMSHDVAKHGVAKFEKSLKDFGWDLHEYYTFESFSRFAPHFLMTKSSKRICFGDFETGKNFDRAAFLNAALPGESPRSKVFGTLGSNIGISKNLTDQDKRFTLFYVINDSCVDQINFEVEWVDMWLFNDRTAFLSFKAIPSKAAEITLDDLARFNQTLRNFPKGDVFIGHGFDAIYDSAQKLNFGTDIVFKNWLGQGNSQQLSIIGTGFGINEFRAHQIDSSVRYAKVMCAARLQELQLLNPSDDAGSDSDYLEFLWNLPTIDPAVNFENLYNELITGKRPELFLAYQSATTAGYPTYGDFVLYDLATTGTQGSAIGHGSPKWKASPEYIRGLFDDSGIEIWEYWRGIALKDTLTFLSRAEDNTCRNNDNLDQAERNYHFLYIYSYHSSMRLSQISDELIDADLTNWRKARQLCDRFNRFRNQYWFNSITVDFQGVELVKQINAGLGLEDHFEMVASEIGDITSFVEDKVSKGKETLIASSLVLLYPFFFLIDGLGLTDFINSFGEENLLPTVVMMVVAELSILFLLFRYQNPIYRVVNRLLGVIYSKDEQ